MAIAPPKLFLKVEASSLAADSSSVIATAETLSAFLPDSCIVAELNVKSALSINENVEYLVA